MKFNSEFLKTAIGIVQTVLVAVLIFMVARLHTDIQKLNAKVSRQLSVNTPPPTPKTVNLKPDPDAPTMGSDSAKVIVTVISDFECSYCKVFAGDILPRLRDEYVATGKVKIIFRDLALKMHENAFTKAEAAACANDQGKFWEIHDYLFENQQKSGTAFFNDWAGGAGIDSEEFRLCLENHHYREKIEEGMRELNEAGIRGTPAILINDKLTMGTRPYAYFKNLIEKELSACEDNTAACQ